MSDMFNSIAKGLAEAIEFEQGIIGARRSNMKVLSREKCFRL